MEIIKSVFYGQEIIRKFSCESSWTNVYITSREKIIDKPQILDKNIKDIYNTHEEVFITELNKLVRITNATRATDGSMRYWTDYIVKETIDEVSKQEAENILNQYKIQQEVNKRLEEMKKKSWWKRLFKK